MSQYLDKTGGYQPTPQSFPHFAQKLDQNISDFYIFLTGKIQGQNIDDALRCSCCACAICYYSLQGKVEGLTDKPALPAQKVCG
jgi:hypothetical protein